MPYEIAFGSKRGVAAARAVSALFAGGARGADGAWVLQQGLHLHPYPDGDPAKLTPHVLVFLPHGFEQGKSPLIVLLHGGSGGGNDVQRLRSLEAIRGCQGVGKLTIYPKGGHDAWTDTYSTASLYEWLASQRR